MDAMPVAATDAAAPVVPPVRRDSFAWLQEMAKEAAAQQKRKAAETPRRLFLPGFDIGVFPNHLNRSSLIAPIARLASRKIHQ